jgi:hypothetical protein
VDLERGPLSLMSTIEELFGRKSSVSGLEKLNYGRRDPSRLTRGTLYPQNFVLTSPTIGGRSVGVVFSRTQATEFSFGLCKQKDAAPLLNWFPALLMDDKGCKQKMFQFSFFFKWRSI